MPKVAKALTAIQVKRLTEPKMHAVGTVPGLMLNVKSETSRAWVLRTTIGARRADIGLGGYPGVTLAEAIENARLTKAKIREGIDPQAERRGNRGLSEWTFKKCATAYIDGHKAQWTNSKHAAQWTNTLVTYVYPVFGEKNVKDVQVVDVLAAIEPHWTTKTETMNRVRNRIEMVLSWAATRGYRPKENPASWRGNLDDALAKPSKVKNEQHHPAIQIDEAKTFMTAVRGLSGTVPRCLEFVALTACRSGEARGAVWSEFDMTAKQWIIPGTRMKSGREHRVPLSEPVIALLTALPHFAGTDLVFPGRTGKVPLSDMTLTVMMRRMTFKDKDGRQAVPHGLRSTFSDWGAERTHYPVNVIEMALAHAIGDGTVEAYRRGDLLDKRIALMADWAAFLV